MQSSFIFHGFASLALLLHFFSSHTSLLFLFQPFHRSMNYKAFIFIFIFIFPLFILTFKCFSTLIFASIRLWWEKIDRILIYIYIYIFKKDYLKKKKNIQSNKALNERFMIYLSLIKFKMEGLLWKFIWICLEILNIIIAFCAWKFSHNCIRGLLNDNK